jgi:hypothetical protein
MNEINRLRRIIVLGMTALLLLGACLKEEAAVVDDGKTGNYSIGIDQDIKNGRLTVNRSRADKEQIITVRAIPAEPSEWRGEGDPPVSSASKNGAGVGPAGTQPRFPWYTDSLSVKQNASGKTVLYTKQAVNTWTFKMPAENVTVSAIFNQTPDKSGAELLRLDLSAGRLVTPLTNGNFDYTADVPHFYDGEKFFIEAETENPAAEVKLFAGMGENETECEFDQELTLKEGKANSYKIKVVSEDGSAQNIYSLTASYSADLSIKSIRLESPDISEWSQPLPVLDEQEITVPYDKITIKVETNAGADSGVRVDVKNNGIITAHIRPVIVSLSKVTEDGAAYQKNYVLRIRRGPENFPNKMLADGGGVIFVPVSGTDLTKGYYEVHEFRNTGAGRLTFNDSAEIPSTAEVLVVAGGGGGGGGCGRNMFAYGGGGGAGGVVYDGLFPISKQSYDVIVGKGGDNGGTSQSGANGGNSKFGGITAYGGGGGGAGGETGDVNKRGSDGHAGGSGGGGGSSLIASLRDTVGGDGQPGQGSDGNPPVYRTGGRGGGREFGSDITGEYVVYGKGGPGRSGGAGAPNTGNGGSGKAGGTNAGCKGGSGIVVVRFIAAAPSAPR